MQTEPTGLQFFDPLLDEVAERMQATNSAVERELLTALFAAMGLFERKMRTLQRSASAPATISTPTPITAQEIAPADSEKGPYYGLGIGHAAKLCIENSGREMHVSEIWDVLHKAGVNTAHSHPHAAVYDGLKRRSSTVRDVVRLPNGNWDLAKRYTKERLAEFMSANRSRTTVAGMEIARQRGARIGQPRKVTDESRADIEARIAAGERMDHIAKVHKMSEGCLRTYYNAAAIREIRERAKQDQADNKDTGPKLVVNNGGPVK